jgi:Family of unknown function (DUF5681)
MTSKNNERGGRSEADPSAGCGKPPVDTRFRKGVSGNPNGRPKGSCNVGAVLARTLREKVVINEHGQRKTISKLEAAIKQFVNKAASGDLRALQMLVTLAREAESRQTLPSSERSPLGEIDQRIIEGILKRFQPVIQTEGENTDEKPSVKRVLRDLAK